MEMVNGYVFLDLTKANVYQKALKVLTTDKPVVVSDGSGAPYFVDSMTVDGTNVVITKGGKTITIANDNTITSVGDIQPLMENIVDLQGNKRFIEGDGVSPEIEGVTFNYNKWSLSGSHLMFVLSGEIANGTVIAGAQTYATYELPNWIYDKIIPYVNNRIEIKGQYYYDSSYGTQTATSLLIKNTSPDTISIVTSAITLNADRNFRIQFDLLIDAE